MTKEEMEQVNTINVYLRDEKGIPMKESFGIAMLIIENRDFIKKVLFEGEGGTEMSYFPCDIPYMSPEELEENGIRIPKDKRQEQPEIIRCKDCKEFRRWIDTDIEFCDRTENRVSENDFCSMAERRTDE